MGLLDLFVAASTPVLKFLLVTALGSFLAIDRIDILGNDARKHLNKVVFYVFSPALIAANLARTITVESLFNLWFMPFNILATYIIGSALGWIVIIISRTPSHLKGLIIGCCSAGNLGSILLVIVPSICAEKGSPFGDPDVCYRQGMAYVSLSMARFTFLNPVIGMYDKLDAPKYGGLILSMSSAQIAAIYMWTYVYNIVRLSASEKVEVQDRTDSANYPAQASEVLTESFTEALLRRDNYSHSENQADQFSLPSSSFTISASTSNDFKQRVETLAGKVNFKKIFAPSTIGAIVGFVVGVIPQIRRSMIGASAPLRVIQDSALLLGDAAVPARTLIVGGNLNKGLKESGTQVSVIVGIVLVRYILLPVSGLFIVKGAVHIGAVSSNPLYHYILLLQYAVPPALNIGTITQLFGKGVGEYSVIMLWTYALASISLTLWSTLFMWLVAAL